jgi:osmoprotectant transport system substrate-binding protein
MLRSRMVLGAALAAVALVVTACSSGNPTSSDGGKAASDTVVVGSANFQESVLLANIYAEALKAKGVKVSTKLNIGSREAYIPGLQDGSIDLMPEYTGNLLLYFNKTAPETTSEEVYAALPKALPAKLIVLDQAKAEDKDAIVVNKDVASKYNLKGIADLAPVASKLTLGGPPEFKTRPDGIPGLKKNYNVTFGTYRTLDAGGPLTVNALKNGQVDAGDIFTTDPSIPQNNFVVLDDPKYNFIAQNVVPLINKGKASDKVKDALNAVSAKLETQTLIDLLTKVVSEKKDANAVAKEWLSSVGLT